MEKTVQCNYCNKAVTTLSALSCKHQVCSFCFHYLCLYNKDTLLTDNKKGEEVTLKCLKCNTGILKITRKKIHQICCETKVSHTEKKPLCPKHKKEQDLYCKECKDFMCKKCFDAHKVVQAFFTHQSTTEPINKSCPKHRNNTLEFQCLDCDTPICDSCTKIDHKDHKMEYIVNFYEPKMREISDNFKKMPFKTFEEYDDCLLKEHDQLQRTITKQFKLLRNKVQNKEVILRNTKKLKEEATINYEITRSLYKHLFQEHQTLSPEDYFKISILSKLPYKLPHFTQINQKQINKALTQRIINYDQMKVVKTLTGHSFIVTCLIQLQDGKIASGSYDGTIRVWNPKNNNCMKTTLKGHSYDVCCLIQLQDGKLASGSRDKTIRVWNPKNNKCMKTLTGHTSSVECLIQLQDGKIASGSYDDAVRVWNPNDDYNCMKTLTVHEVNVYCLIQLQDGKIASGASDYTIRVWNPKNNKCVTLKGHTSFVTCLIQLQDGKIASGDGDKTIKVWNPNDNYNCIKTLKGHGDYVSCLIQLQDGRILSGSWDTTIRVWNPNDDYNCMKTLTGHSKSVSCLIQLQDGKLASGSTDGTIRVWDPNDDYNCIKTLTGHSSDVLCLIQLQDGKLASGSYDTIRVWNSKDDVSIQEKEKCCLIQ